MEKETKKIILEKIKNAQSIQGKNSMGVSESFYDPYFLVRKFKNIEEYENNE